MKSKCAEPGEKGNESAQGILPFPSPLKKPLLRRKDKQEAVGFGSILRKSIENCSIPLNIFISTYQGELQVADILNLLSKLDVCI